MPPISSIPFGPQFQVPIDLHPQLFPSSSRIDTQFQQPFVPPTAHPHLQTVDPATTTIHPFASLHQRTSEQGLALGTQTSSLAVAHHNAIDMAESSQDLSGQLSISQHLSAVQHDILNTDNPDFVLVPTSIESGYSFVPTSTQTNGTNQPIIVSTMRLLVLNLILIRLLLMVLPFIFGHANLDTASCRSLTLNQTRPRHLSMPAWFPNGYGSHITPMATPMVRSMSSMASMQTTSHATRDALFSKNETFSVSSGNTIQATMLDISANAMTNVDTTSANAYPAILGSDGGCAHKFTVAPDRDILQPRYSPESATGSVVSSTVMNSQFRETTSPPQAQAFGLPSTVTSRMSTAVSLTMPTPFRQQGRGYNSEFATYNHHGQRRLLFTGC